MTLEEYTKMIYHTSPKQKFPVGSRVMIADSLGPTMSHFKRGVEATVLYTYSQKYGGFDYGTYALYIEGEGMVAWYYEHQLTLIEE